MTTAVLSGDIIRSARLPAAQRSALLAQWLREVLPTVSFELNQGDAFQLQTSVADALPLALRIRAHFRAQPPLNKYRPDVRISIGLGTVDYAGRTLAKSAGTAFERSGRGLQSLKHQPAQLQITSAHPPFDAACNTSLGLLETLVQRWTVVQAATTEAALRGLNQQQIAELRGISQPAAQQTLVAAGWPGVAALLAYYQAEIIRLQP